MADEDHFTVFIRLPFPRGDFVDPPPVRWDSSKDQALWDILSQTSKGREIDWHALASQFDVDLAFLLQQAAWLYDRQLSQVKAQLRKVNRPSSIGQSPIPGSVTGSGVTGAQAMARTSSGAGRVPSSLAMRQKERPISQGEGSIAEVSPPTNRIRISRNSSTSTVHQIQKPSPTIMQQSGFESPGVAFNPPKARDGLRKSIDTASKEILVGSASSKAHNSTSSSSSDSETARPMSRSRAYMRRPRHPSAKTALGPLSDNDDQDEDDADSPPFLPFSDPKAAAKAQQSSSSPPSSSTDPNATVRMAHQKRAVPSTTNPSHTTLAPQPPLNSSSSSAQSQPQFRPPRHHHHQHPQTHPQSPARIPEQQPASALSPRQRRVTGKEGSEGTPSMGSSFSDLDDASVTQSALEEALLAQEMEKGGGSGGGGGVASRMSTISQALRSRYL